MEQGLAGIKNGDAVAVEEEDVSGGTEEESEGFELVVSDVESVIGFGRVQGWFDEVGENQTTGIELR